MGTFDQDERSVEASKPVEIYEFTLGIDAPVRFTSAEDTISFGGENYLPESIERNSVALGKDERQRLLQIKIPLANEFAAQYIGIPPGERAQVVVRRLQRDAIPFTARLLFDGFLQSVRFPDDRWAILGVQSLEAALAQIIPRFTYQGLCNHFLYDNQCGIIATNFQLSSALVTAESGNTITVTGAGASGLNFTGGFVKPIGVNDFRMVTAQSGDVLTLLLPFKVSPLNQTIDAFAGCNRIIDEDCLLVFNNPEEHGGFPFIPKRNPIGGNIVVS